MEIGSWGNNFKNGFLGLRDKVDGIIFEKWERINYSYLCFCFEGNVCIFYRMVFLLRIINLRGESYY